MNIVPSFLLALVVGRILQDWRTLHKMYFGVEIQPFSLAARPGGALPPGGSGGGQSPPPPPPQGRCNYPSGSYGARPDYQTGRCRCKVQYRVPIQVVP